MRKILSLLLTGAVVYAAVVLGAYLMQRRLMYFPDTTRVDPAAAGVHQVREIEIARPEDVTLVAWYKPPEAGRPTILYFHGNAGNVASRAPRAAHWAAAGYGVLFPNYRGYGGSGGSPSETTLVGDGLAAYDFLEGKGIAGNSIVVYGESLGSGVAVQVAVAREALAVVLEAPFTSATDVAVRAYPFLPARWLLMDRFDSLSRIAEVGAPLLVVHGDRDEVVPYALGQQLFEAGAEPKQFFVVPDTGHNALDNPQARAAVEQFIEEALARVEGG